jgi:hypothetical protein
MARIRRPKQINGSEYTFGGGSGSGGGAVGGLVKIAKGNMNPANANHDGFLSSGDTVSFKLDAGTAIVAKDQYIYFDNAFDTSSGSFSYEFMNGDTALPAGMSFTANNDTEGSDVGYARFYGTPTTEGTNSFKIKAFYNLGTSSEQVEIIYTIKRFAAGTTPVWSATDLPAQIVRNTAGDQVLAAGPATTYADATFTLSNVSGFAVGVVPTIDAATGQVVVTGVGDIVQAASTHAFTVTADLGSEIGTFTQAFSSNVSYGDPYDAIYWGPGNAKINVASYATNYSGNRLTSAQYSNLFNHEVKSGALRCRTNSQYSTSPYQYNGNIGLRYTENHAWSSGSIGYLGPKCSSNNSSNADGAVSKFLWTVPNGITSFSAVCVGGGSGGSYNWSGYSGGGAGMAWINGVLCTPGEEFEIALGHGRRGNFTSEGSYWAGSSWIRRVVARDYGANEWIIIGYGGGYQNGHASPLSGRSNPDSANLQHIESYNANNSRDPGGAAASNKYGTYGINRGGYASSRGGGGAAGYQGQGANSDNNNGQGGGGGSGQQYSSTYGVSAGGGVGLDGRGAGGTDSSGSGWGATQGAYSTNHESDGTMSYRYAGGGGSGGTRGAYGENPQTSSGGIDNRYINGGMHGGGAGGSGTSYGGGAGGSGGVRIIWGTGRSFPYSYTTEDPNISDSRNPGDGR